MRETTHGTRFVGRCAHLADLLARAAADLRRHHAGLRPDARPTSPSSSQRRSPRNGRAARYIAGVRVRSAELAHHRLLALPAAAHRRRRSSWCSAQCWRSASKFILRFDGKHIFNPGNFGIAVTAAVHRRRLDLAGAMGQHDLGGVPVHLPRLPRAVARQARRHRHRLPRHPTSPSCSRAPSTSAIPLAIPMKQMQSGALLLFTFFMITDPRPRPTAAAPACCSPCWWRLQRRLAAVRPLHAAGADLRAVLRFSAGAAARSVRSPRPRQTFASSGRGRCSTDGDDTYGATRCGPWLAVAALSLSPPASMAAQPAQAFCGFYVAKADAKLFNKASKVVVARKGEQTAVTMASDYQGDLKEFALVIPVPTVVKKDQIKIDRERAGSTTSTPTAPRGSSSISILTPAIRRVPICRDARRWRPCQRGTQRDARAEAAALGVRIEAEYTVGEYDILILSATQSDGLATWLTDGGYKIPAGAAPGARLLHQAEHEVLRRPREPQGAGQDRQPVSAPDPGELRDAQVHAADPPRHGERRRPAGHDHADADREGPRRDHQLPHRPHALRTWTCRSSPRPTSATSTAPCSTTR